MSVEELEVEIERLKAWLVAIDGGDMPIDDASELRQLAYRAITLGHTYNE